MLVHIFGRQPQLNVWR